MKTKTLLLSLLLSTPALAETPVRVVLLGATGAPMAQQMALISAVARTKLDGAGKPIAVTKLAIRPTDPCVAQNTLQGFPEQFYCYEKIAQGLRRFRSGPTIVVSGPMVANGQLYIGGAARGNACSRHVSRRVAWAALTPANAAGESRINASGITMAHELGHVFGATHASDVSIMSTNAIVLSYTNNLSFSAQSISEMSRCRNDGSPIAQKGKGKPSVPPKPTPPVPDGGELE
jgi:hypothetical protein